MKAVTLYQPWASLVIAGVKRFETRSWATSYRGTLAIHAGKADPWKTLEPVPYAELDRICLKHGLGEMGSLPRGVILGRVDVVECMPMVAGWPDGLHIHTQKFDADGRAILLDVNALEWKLGDWSHGRYAWELANPVAFPEPIPARGQQGLWAWDECSVDQGKRPEEVAE